MLMCADLLKTSAAMGTVELTGLEMMATQAPGQYLATPAHRFATMPARGAVHGSASLDPSREHCEVSSWLPEGFAALLEELVSAE